MAHVGYRELHHPWIQNQNFDDVTTEFLLNEIRAQRLINKAQPLTWIFDLDSTLICTGFRTHALIKNFITTCKELNEIWHWIYANLDPSAHQYSVRFTFYSVLRLRFSHLESKHLSKKLWHEFEDFWNQGFFSSRYIRLDRAYLGAKKFLQTIHQEGDHLIYLSGRDIPRTYAGTADSLRLCGFPVSSNTRLILKPRTNQSDVEFKELVAKTLCQSIQLAFCIDNEAENIEIFKNYFNPQKIVFFHSITSPRPAKIMGPTKRLSKWFEF